MQKFEGKVAIVTGGMHGIGKAITAMFEREGAAALVFDVRDGGYFVGNLAKKEDIETFAQKVLEEYGHVDFLINNAAPLMKGIGKCTYEEFDYALAVGVKAPFYLTKLFAEHFGKDGCIINISSTRDRMSMPQTESYSAAKGGISALTHALANSLAGIVRVNSISPGWIDTDYTVYEGPDADQQLVHRVGNPDDIAEAVKFLCSPEAGFIDGQDLCIDGGMTKQMIYHEEHGWTLEK